jgi:hypothetical protein
LNNNVDDTKGRDYVILKKSEGSQEILRAKALRMTQRECCHPERSEGSQEILRAEAPRMTKQQGDTFMEDYSL